MVYVVGRETRASGEQPFKQRSVQMKMRRFYEYLFSRVFHLLFIIIMSQLPLYLQSQDRPISCPVYFSM